MTRTEVLVLLSEKARAGSVTTAVMLERALRLAPLEEERDEEDIWSELDRFQPIRGKRH